MRIEVAYALPEKQVIIALNLHPGSQVLQAIDSSGILQRFPEINMAQAKVGIFGKVVSLDTVLQPGDRVEIYRPLLIDPKQARRQKALEKKGASGDA
jgi:putative ubiquitin-RnfH superfamily antitoxin RatB of RatAB toxin-antitoxin module